MVEVSVVDKPLRTLIVSDIPPYPSRYGGAMRMDTVARALASYGPVDLLLLRYRPLSRPLPPMFARIHTLTLPLSDEPAAQVETDRVIADRRFVTEQVPDWLRDEHYDLLWFNRERCWLRARGVASAPSVVDIDDREEVLLRRWVELGLAPTGEPLTAQAARRMRRAAAWWAASHDRTARDADVLLVSSDRDRKALAHANVLVLPNTYATTPDQSPAICGPRRPTLLFPALLRWPPNEDAASWLVEVVAPLVRRRIPDVRIMLAGNASDHVHALGRGSGIEVTGEVASMTPYLASAGAVVVPLRVGGGTRIKILEAFAHRVPVVSTTIGAEGLAVSHDVQLALADRAEDFAAECVRLLTDQAAAERLTSAGYDLYHHRYSPQHAAEAIHAAVNAALTRPPRMREAG